VNFYNSFRFDSRRRGCLLSSDLKIVKNAKTWASGITNAAQQKNE